MNPAEKKAGEALAAQVQAAKADFMQPLQHLAGNYFRCQQHCYEKYTTLLQAEDCKLRCNAVMSSFNNVMGNSLSEVFTGFFKCATACREKGETCLPTCHEAAGVRLKEAKETVLTTAEKASKKFA